MRAIILQHASYEGPGYILSWLHEQGFATDICFIYKTDTPLPNILSASLLIVLGGPMSVYQEDEYPWLIEEKKLIRQAVDNNIPTLGICLGAQLIASVFGAEVSPAPSKAVGWFPSKKEHSGKKNHFNFPENFTSLFWHSDEFDIPKDGTRLASSAICDNQAFQINNHVIGVQFHLHMTPFLLQSLISNSTLGLTNDPHVQPPHQLLSAPASFFIQNNHLVNDMLSYLLIKGRKRIN